MYIYIYSLWILLIEPCIPEQWFLKLSTLSLRIFMIFYVVYFNLGFIIILYFVVFWHLFSNVGQCQEYGWKFSNINILYVFDNYTFKVWFSTQSLNIKLEEVYLCAGWIVLFIINWHYFPCWNLKQLSRLSFHAILELASCQTKD